jgi:hypothetical protein
MTANRFSVAVTYPDEVINHVCIPITEPLIDCSDVKLPILKAGKLLTKTTNPLKGLRLPDRPTDRPRYVIAKETQKRFDVLIDIPPQVEIARSCVKQLSLKN